LVLGSRGEHFHTEGSWKDSTEISSLLVLEERHRMSSSSSSASSSSSCSSSSSSTHTSDESVEIYTPELLWHGGGNENGKPDPVYSVDMHPLDVLATAGIDANIPPKGSVRVRIHSSIGRMRMFRFVEVAQFCIPRKYASTLFSKYRTRNIFL
jgi:hypothetical protein